MNNTVLGSIQKPNESTWNINPCNATHITIHFFVHKGDQKTQIGTLNWCKEDKKKTSTNENAKPKPVGSSSKQNITLGTMKCEIDIASASKEGPQFNITFTSTEPQSIPPKELAQVKFSYTITGEGDVSNVQLIRGNKIVGDEKNLKDLLKKSLTANESQQAQFTLQQGEATKVTIQFFLEKDGNKISIGEYVWRK